MWLVTPATYFWVEPRKEVVAVCRAQAPSPIRAYYCNMFKSLVSLSYGALGAKERSSRAGKISNTRKGRIIREEHMGRLQLGFTLAALMLLAGGASAADVKLVYVGEISGSIAVSGGNFRDGIILAVEEINAKGGILKEKIALSQLDTQTNPGVARSQMQKAIDGDPYVVFGPIFSGNVKVDHADAAAGRDSAYDRRRGRRADRAWAIATCSAPRSASRSACRRSRTTFATSSRQRRSRSSG